MNPEDIIDAEPTKDTPKGDAWGYDDDDILKDARKKYAACKSADSDNRIAAIADLQFLAGGDGQWDTEAVQARRMDGRPVITVNCLPTYLHQVTNDQRMNTPAIKVHPVDDDADVETAKVRQGLIRHIEYDSNADVAYDTAVNSAAAVGFGYFRLITDFETPTSWDQKIMFQRIRNVMSVRIDPLSVEPDGSDMRFAFVELKESKETFRREHPKAKAGGDTNGLLGDSSYTGWFDDTSVLVCDFYRIETKEAEVVLLSNGETGFKDDLLEIPSGVTIAKTRKGEKSRVMLYKITGCDILDKTEIKCKWIPVFPVYGDEIDIEGKVIRSGIVRHAKGPAQMYNVMMTSATEEISLRAKSPYIMAEGQDEGWEDEWAQANVRAFPTLHYKPVELNGNLAPAPQRNPMADVPAGMLAMSMHASDNIKKTTGLFDASLGARGTATSGVQERAQQKEGDVANFHYMDGLLRTIRHAGRCLNYMLPFYYDTQRTVRILGEDDTASYATINDGKLDLTAGEYDITVTAGPSFTTARQENLEFFTNAMAASKDPATTAIYGYLAMSNQDVPGAERALKMIETTLPPPAKAVIEEDRRDGDEEQPTIQTDEGPLPVAQVPQVLSQMKAQIQQMGEALEKAQAAKQQTELMKQQHAMAEQQLEPARIQTEREKAAAASAKAEAERISAQADLIRAQMEAQAAPAKAQAEIHKAEADRMTAEISYITAETEAKVAVAKAQAEGLNGDMQAFEVWKATLESETRIRVAEIMARARTAPKETQS